MPAAILLTGTAYRDPRLAAYAFAALEALEASETVLMEIFDRFEAVEE